MCAVILALQLYDTVERISVYGLLCDFFFVYGVEGLASAVQCFDRAFLFLVASRALIPFSIRTLVKYLRTLWCTAARRYSSSSV